MSDAISSSPLTILAGLRVMVVLAPLLSLVPSYVCEHEEFLQNEKNYNENYSYNSAYFSNLDRQFELSMQSWLYSYF